MTTKGQEDEQTIQYYNLIERLAKKEKRVIEWFCKKSYEDRNKMIEEMEEKQFAVSLLVARLQDLKEEIEKRGEKGLFQSHYSSLLLENSYLSQVMLDYIDGREEESMQNYDMLTRAEKAKLCSMIQNSISYNEKVEGNLKTALQVCGNYHKPS